MQSKFKPGFKVKVEFAGKVTWEPVEGYVTGSGTLVFDLGNGNIGVRELGDWCYVHS